VNINDKRKRQLFKDLKNKDYRNAYVSSSVDVGVASQIRALREQREWNQSKLAKEAKMHQVRISELENPSHSPTLATLKKLATAFDVALIVRFLPFSDLVKWKLDMSAESLEVQSFQQEEFFKEKPGNESDSDLLGVYYSGNNLAIQTPPSGVVDIASYQKGTKTNKENKDGSLISKTGSKHMAFTNVGSQSGRG